MAMSRRVLTFPRFMLATVLAGALVLLIGLGQATPASAADVAVGINNFAFTPAMMTVPVGTRVVWTNMQASVPHTVTSDTAGVFDSGSLSTGQTFAFTFNQAGTFAYHCNIHPNMHGTIIVQAAGATTAATSAATTVATTASTSAGTTPTAVVTRPAATGTGGGVVTATVAPVPTATRPAATAVPASMPRAGGGGLATSYVDADSGASRGLWLGILGALAVVAAGGWYALRLRRR